MANYELHRSTNRSLGVSVEGRYERCTWPNGKSYWDLKEWRVISVYRGHMTVGKWYRRHGNQRKDIGCLKLLRDEPPVIDGPPLGDYETEVARG